MRAGDERSWVAGRLGGTTGARSAQDSQHPTGWTAPSLVPLKPSAPTYLRSRPTWPVASMSSAP